MKQSPRNGKEIKETDGQTILNTTLLSTESCDFFVFGTLW